MAMRRSTAFGDGEGAAGLDRHDERWIGTPEAARDCLVLAGRRSQQRPGSRSAMRIFSQAARKLVPAFTALFGLSFALNLLVFVSPLYTMQIYDRVLTSRNATTLVMLSLIVCGLFVAYAALEHFRSRALIQVGLNLDRSLSGPAFEAALESAVAVKGSHHVQLLRDVDTLRETLSGSAVPSLMDAPWIPIYLGLCFLIHPAIGAVAMIGAILILLVAFLSERITKRSLTTSAEIGRQAVDRLSSCFRNAEVIRALGMGEAVRGIWQGQHTASLRHHTEASEQAGTLLAAAKFLRLGLQCAVLGVGAYLAIRQDLNPGVIFAASLIMSRALAPIETAIGHWRNLVGARNAIRRLRAVLDEAPPRPLRMSLPRPSGKLLVENLAVCAPGSGTPLVRNVSFSLAPGEIAAIVGPTGSGKSSLARALVGVWPAAQGTVRLDGNDIDHFRPDQLAEVLGYLPQDVELFAGSVRDNIARFDPRATDEAVVAAAEAASAHAILQSLPDGYGTVIGEDGATLSGGQRQRIGLARAVYGHPALVVLDEPNASLDADGDAALARAILALRATGSIVVVITHRSQLLSAVGTVILMHRGEAVRVGSRDEIMPLLFGPNVIARPMPRPGSVTTQAAGPRVASR